MPEISPERNLGSENLLWAISFQDMLSLILAFFILMFAMSEVKKPLSEKDHPKNYFPQQSPGSTIPEQGLGPFNLQPPPALNLHYLINVIHEKIKDIPYLKQSLIIPYRDRVIISLPSDIVFETARANLTKDAQQALLMLAEGLRTIPNRLQIYGYTDPRPIRGGFYISNWELSLARAISVEKTLLNGGYDRPILTQGFSDTSPILLNELKNVSTTKDTNSLLRRVDIALFQSGTL